MTANARPLPAERLLGFYVDKSRALPWRVRSRHEVPDPYRVWLSEIMLQQTTVAAVIPRFVRFIERWPTIDALAGASDEDILNEWAGLGYYARARNLIACAREVAAAGGFPRSSVELRKLPGLGDYTAAAVAAIAFGEQVAPVDTNVARVIGRLEGLEDPRRTEIARRFLELAPRGRAGDTAQALMDLGATICRPRAPRCHDCPLAAECKALQSGKPEMFCVPKMRARRPQRHGTAWWIERDSNVWLVRRPLAGLLGGMAALPGTQWSETIAREREGSEIGRVRHLFTHFALDLSIVVRSTPCGEGWWQPLDALGKAGLPTLYLRAANLVLAGRDTLDECGVAAA